MLFFWGGVPQKATACPHSCGQESLAIDEFGAGYSWLSYLKRFPIHVLKIDHSFVHDVATDAETTEIIKAIISLAHSLQLKVVAEGIETKEQLQFLRTHGCDVAQGYVFSRPLHAIEVTRLLEKLSSTDIGNCRRIVIFLDLNPKEGAASSP